MSRILILMEKFASETARDVLGDANRKNRPRYNPSQSCLISAACGGYKPTPAGIGELIANCYRRVGRSGGQLAVESYRQGPGSFGNHETALMCLMHGA